jgi:ATP adenylyltransferase
MDKLWAPWRSKYIYLRKRGRCIFCGNKGPAHDRTRHIIDRSRHSFSMLNLYPYNNGHVMVAPFRHVKDLSGLSRDEFCDMMDLVRRTKKKLDARMKPDGYNIGMNIGKVAGAGFAGHLHIHIVPRWNGDTNFMPIIGNTKVVPDSLDTVQRLLKG